MVGMYEPSHVPFFVYFCPLLFLFPSYAHARRIRTVTPHDISRFIAVLVLACIWSGDLELS